MIIKNHFHNKGFALGLVLKQRLAASRKWPIVLCYVELMMNVAHPKHAIFYETKKRVVVLLNCIINYILYNFKWKITLHECN